jgi:hypothetical protein
MHPHQQQHRHLRRISVFLFNDVSLALSTWGSLSLGPLCERGPIRLSPEALAMSSRSASAERALILEVSRQ